MTKLLKIASDEVVAKTREYDSVQFNLDPADAAKVLGIEVNPEDWSTFKGRETQPHVTVLFGLEDATLEQLEAITSGIGEIEVELGSTEVWPGTEEEHQSLIINVKSDKLVALHRALSVLPHHDTHPDYKPHIAIGNVKPGTGGKYVSGLEGTKMVLSDMVLSSANKTTTPLAKTLANSGNRQASSHGGNLPPSLSL